MPTDPSQYRQELVKRLDMLRRNGTFCDVTVAVNSRDFKAHKCVLAAASPFFLTHLTSDTKDVRIELEEATPSVMEAMLQYVYTGNIIVTEKRAQKMLVIGDYLRLPNLNKLVLADTSRCCQQLVERLDVQRRNDSFCDVTVAVTSRDFRAHKCVLAAASPFFFTLLTSDMRESNENLIKIELEEATEPVMQDLLQYVYTGNVMATEDNAHNLIASADYLLLPSLKTVVGRYLSEHLTVENCIFNYYFAYKYRCVELKEKACEVINSNFTAVTETDDFLSLNMNEVLKWVSSDDITVNAEKDVFNGIVRWVNENRIDRESCFSDLLFQVRLISISHECLVNELIKEDLLAKNAEICLKFLVDAMKLMTSVNDGQVIQRPRKCLEIHTDVIFVCGGRRSLCYIPNRNLWLKLSDMRFKHNHEHNPIQFRGKIYLGCGCSDKLGGLNLMESYTPATNFWCGFQVTNSLKSTAVLNGYLYAIYGNIGWQSSKHLHRCDPEKNYCYELKAPPTIRHSACFVADEQYLYLIGGFTSGMVLSTTERFDPGNLEWEEVAPVNEARSAACGAAMNGKVYIAGGHQVREALSTCEVYNPLTNVWQLMPNLKIPRAYASMVAHQGQLYVLGGFKSRGNPHSRVLLVEVFDSEQNVWKEKSLIPVKTSKEDGKNSFKACFARLEKRTINSLEPLKVI